MCVCANEIVVCPFGIVLFSSLFCACILFEKESVLTHGLDRCPWTGTAIGKRNMPAFQAFVGLVFVCLIFDIMLLTGFFG